VKKSGPTFFLEKQSYRRRRLADAAKVLPVLGAILLCLPILWASEARTAQGLIYIFGVWALLILVMWWLSARLPKSVSDVEDGLETPSERKTDD